jgi:hypothetical protein
MSPETVRDKINSDCCVGRTRVLTAVEKESRLTYRPTIFNRSASSFGHLYQCSHYVRVLLGFVTENCPTFESKSLQISAET